MSEDEEEDRKPPPAATTPEEIAKRAKQKAQAPRVSLSARIGLDRRLPYVRPNGVVPIRLILEEKKSTTFTGEVVLEEEVDLHQPAVRRNLKVRIPIKLEKDARIVVPLELSMPSLVDRRDGSGPLWPVAQHAPSMTFRVVDDQGVAVSIDTPNRAIRGRERLILVVDPQRGSSLSKLRTSGKREDLDRDARAFMFNRLDELPASSTPLEGVDAVVIPALALASTTDERRAALADFVRDGGTLTITGGPGAANALRSAALAPFSPVDVVAGDEAERTVHVGRGLERACGLWITEPVRVVNWRKRAGARLLVMGDDREPLVVEQRLGLGRVVVVAFGLDDPALQMGDWDELARVILPPAAPRSFTRPMIDWGTHWGGDDPLCDAPDKLGRQIGTPTPPVGEVLGVLLVYLFCLLPVGVILFHAAGKLELFWLAVPVVAVSFSAFLGLRARELYGRTTALVEGRVIELASGTTSGPMRRLAGVLSPTRHKYTIDLPKGERPYFAPTSGSYSSRSLEVLVQPRGFRIEAFEVLLGEVGFFETRGRAELSGPIEYALGVGGAPVAELSNRTGEALEEAWIVSAGQSFSVGTLAAGESKRVSLDTSVAPRASDPFLNLLAMHAFGSASRVDASGPVLIGRFAGTGEALVLDGRPVQPTRASTVVVVSPRLRLAQGRVKLARPWVEVRQVSLTGAPRSDEAHRHQLLLPRNARAGYVARPILPIDILGPARAWASVEVTNLPGRRGRRPRLTISDGKVSSRASGADGTAALEPCTPEVCDVEVSAPDGAVEIQPASLRVTLESQAR